jgi:hypothetical protein
MTEDAQSPTMVAYKLYNRRVKFPGCVAFPLPLTTPTVMSQRIGPSTMNIKSIPIPTDCAYISCDCFPLVVILVPHGF